MGEARTKERARLTALSEREAAELADRRAGRSLNGEIQHLERELRDLRKQRNKERPAKAPAFKPARQERDEAAGFMAWQHEQGIPCVACLREGPPGADKLKGEPNPIEIAHQRRNSTAAGWQSNRLGKRVSDAQTVPLCRWHHQIAPNACDKGQAKFWDRLNIPVEDYCAELFRAFKGGFPGAPVAKMFALSAKGAEMKADRPRGRYVRSEP